MSGCGGDSDDTQSTTGHYIPFTATVSDTLNQTWISDGTVEGTQMVADFDSVNAEYIYDAFYANGLWFMNVSTTDFGRTLAVTDGTPEGTRIVDGERLTNLFPQHFFAFNDLVFFNGTGTDDDRELWVTDGTAEGTQLFKNLATGNLTSDTPNKGTPAHFVSIGEQFVFAAYTAGTGTEPWVSDGTAEGTRMIKDISDEYYYGSNPYAFTALQDKALFLSEGRTWVTDGTAEGTKLLTSNGPANPRDIISFAGKAIIKANDEQNWSYRGLWITDGTAEGTQRIPTNLSAAINEWLVQDDSLYFTSNGQLYSYTEANGIETYPSDVSSIHSIAIAGDTLIFSASVMAEVELYGLVEGGIIKLHDTSGDDKSGDPMDFVSVNGLAIFTAKDADQGRELWVTDGQSAQLLKDIYEGSESSNPSWCGVSKSCFR